jgi:lipid-A-disaccharide synthase
LPGSRTGELARHLPVIREAVSRLQSKTNLHWQMILPNLSLAEQARLAFAGMSGGEICTGSLAEALSRADLAIASTGTVTMECAWFGVPTIAIYKTSWSTYQIGKRIIKVRYLAMPNILADQPLFPELIQNDATGENIAGAALKLLNDPGQRQTIKTRLKAVTGSLGPPGAPDHAAEAVIDLLRI